VGQADRNGDGFVCAHSGDVCENIWINRRTGERGEAPSAPGHEYDGPSDDEIASALNDVIGAYGLTGTLAEDQPLQLVNGYWEKRTVAEYVWRIDVKNSPSCSLQKT
jgi:hypothetical protein